MNTTVVSRLVDKSDHGGEIITANSDTRNNGIEFAVTSDIHRCPIHGNTPIVTRSAAFHEDKTFAHVGTKTDCGATIITGDADMQFHLLSEKES